MTAKRDEPLSILRQLELMRDLQRLANERAQEEERIRGALEQGLQQADLWYETMIKELERWRAEEKERLTSLFDTACSEAHAKYEQGRSTAQEQYRQLRDDVQSEQKRVVSAALLEQEEANWNRLIFTDVLKTTPSRQYAEIDQALRSKVQEISLLERDAATIMTMRHQPLPCTVEELARISDDDNIDESAVSDAIHRSDQAVGGRDSVAESLAEVDASIKLLRESVIALNRQKLPRLFETWTALSFAGAVVIVTCILTAVWLGQLGWLWLAGSSTVAVAIAFTILGSLWPQARTQSTDQFRVIRRYSASARLAVRIARRTAANRSRRDAKQFAEQLETEQQTIGERVRGAFVDMEKKKASIIETANATIPPLLAKLRADHEAALERAESSFRDSLSEMTAEYDATRAEIEQSNIKTRRELESRFELDWCALAERWFRGIDEFSQAITSMVQQCNKHFPDFMTVTEVTLASHKALPRAIPFGKVSVDLASIKRGMPQDLRLRPERTVFELPALMTLKEHPIMVISAVGAGRQIASEAMQLVMLRFLTGMPPGKVRFTILDPVGLGEDFASFMHLTDFDDRLVSSQIWTEPRQIDEQLTRITSHIETVLQKYLRNQFATIDDYNAAAGEVAEPFQVLVVANFPANFSEAAARKLVSIATSGPRCGVYTLVSIDRKLRLPNEFQLADLLVRAVHLDWQPGERRFRWRYPAFEHLPLALDRPPSAERFNEVVRAAGEAAKSALRVEVPFELVAPADGQFWTGDNSQELAVPIGRAGAMRLQSVRLGRGTSQHLLVAGKTGSGKSTFLHALVTNTALHYSPDQVEFYLIDFKKGVEFKTYAAHRLPHARVIAIESEREFGLSVLERLDAELRRRGELFRTAGVQDLAGFRAARPAEGMPRILLVIDEFQELFVEDDKLAQDAALLLDRLVRQGRAFGIHVLLGSQTLSGAYSLARSTMGQMAVRVALQCSEADAHLILSDERNLAARYLSRPGEAIYNDQNGLLAGNQPFQVVWLPEPQRIEYLRRIEQLATERGAAPAPAIVFEGDQPADPAENRALCIALERGLPGPVTQRAWLGAAVAIKDPTNVVFARHAGSNLLVVGSEEDSAIGVLTNAVIALAAQNASGGAAARFIILDGSRPDSAHAGIWPRVADALAGQVTVAGPRDVPRIIAELAAELAARESAGREDAPPNYLVIYDGGRFRDLRRGEDDFGFSLDRDRPPRPDRQWGEILRNGPAWGIHSLVWCDSYNDVTRLVDRQTLREFELRVVFQMSAADSTNLLDTPAASRLRQHRGLFYNDDLGTVEKFRPYGPPSDAWLARVRHAMASP